MKCLCKKFRKKGFTRNWDFRKGKFWLVLSKKLHHLSCFSDACFNYTLKPTRQVWFWVLNTNKKIRWIINPVEGFHLFKSILIGYSHFFWSELTKQRLLSTLLHTLFMFEYYASYFSSGMKGFRSKRKTRAPKWLYHRAEIGKLTIFTFKTNLRGHSLIT